ncbi:ABC transporter ATP-binding protein [Oribacterium sp. P6A1]|uniref:ABC transporter ATP-binding protein n=1 Tax=Oribacterium sp. P6A1 TaxID=1410612 RepID=UPI00056920A3|nr:ABC transporter ATP-binding protein [Oribacterium sp. P6A1]
MSLIEIKNLKYRYPGTTELALDDISLSIEKGEFIGIAGENGAGKSTLSQALLGLIPQFYKGAYGGSVVVDGLTAKTAPVAELCSKAGLVFQNPFNQLSGAKDTVYDEVGFGLQNLGTEPSEIHARVEEVLKRFGIWEYRDRNPFDLSGGQLQRVAIASVLAMNPGILILDEPTSQLDPAGSEEVFHTVDELTETGITIIMIEQKIEKLAEYCDKIILMHHGRLIDFDTPEKIFSRDDLMEYGVMPPVYTEFARKNALRLPDGNYPVTKKGLLELIKSRGVDREKLLTALLKIISSDVCEPGMEGDKIKSPGKGFSAEASGSESSDRTFTVEDLHFSYIKGNEIFNGINLCLDRRPTAIIGQNGAGKTTLVRILKGLLKPDSGRLDFRGQDIASKTVAELAGKVGYVFQNPDDQIFKYNVLDEVMFGPLNIGMTREEAAERAHEALRTVGLQEVSGKNPYDLELSDRKMVAIASVLAMDTDVIILDEPTIAQDYKGRKKIREIIRDLSSKGKLVIAILHDMDFVAQSFERVIAMAHGEILADGTPDEIFRNHPVLEKAALNPPHLVSLMEELEMEA